MGQVMGHLLEGDLGRQKHCGRCILGLGRGVGDSLRHSRYVHKSRISISIAVEKVHFKI
jgi:hypothetical protein